MILPQRVRSFLCSVGPLMEQAITEIGKNKEGYFKTLPIDCNT